MVGTNTFLGMQTNGGNGVMIKWLGKHSMLQFRNKSVYYYIFLGLLIIGILITKKVMESKMGYYLAAIRTNQGAAATIGVPVQRYKTYAQLMCATGMAIGGILYAVITMVVEPYTILGYDLSLQIMIFCVVGGKGTLWGPVVGAAFLTLFKEVVRVNMGANVAPLCLVLFGVLLIISVMYAPSGIVGLAETLKKKYLQKPDRKEVDSND